MINFDSKYKDAIYLVEHLKTHADKKISAINLHLTTDELINLNTKYLNITDIFLNKQYYSTKFAGQKLLRLVESEIDCK